MTEMKYTYEMVSKAMKEVLEWLDSIENVWGEIRTLKLYDVFYEADKLINKYPLVKETYNADSIFYWFCEKSYDNFIEWMNEEGIKDERKYIGRTSSFYLTDLYAKDKKIVLAELIDKTVNGFNYLDFDDKGNMEKLDWGENMYGHYTEEDLLLNAQDEMEYVASGKFFEDAKKIMQDAIRIADYIDSFMKNQVTYFEEELQFREDELEYQAEQDKESAIMAQCEYGIAI